MSTKRLMAVAVAVAAVTVLGLGAPSAQARQAPSGGAASIGVGGTDPAHDVTYGDPSTTRYDVGAPNDLLRYSIEVDRTRGHAMLTVTYRMKRVHLVTDTVEQVHAYLGDQAVELVGSVGSHRIAIERATGQVRCARPRLTWSTRRDTVTMTVPLPCLNKAGIRRSRIKLETESDAAEGDIFWIDDAPRTERLPLTAR